MIPIVIIVAYLVLLLSLGVVAGLFSRGTGKDYMLASHTIGPFLLLMSLFGTTMTAFALVGSTGQSFRQGIVVYGLMASSSGIVHSLCFYLLGPKLWSFGKRHGYTTQIEFFRARLDSRWIGLLLFPILVGLVIPYLLIGVMSAGIVINRVSAGDVFPGGIPQWLGSLAISAVVLAYVFFGGMRATAWANAFQTMVFLILGVITFFVIAHQLGGIESATRAVIEHDKTLRENRPLAAASVIGLLGSPETQGPLSAASTIHPGTVLGKNEKLITARTPAGQSNFLSYLLIPLSVGMFPHVFQHWLTAKSSSTFKLPIIMHPLFILILWLPCVLVGVWATSAQAADGSPIAPAGIRPDAVLIVMVDRLTSPALTGLLSAGILAAIMSSLDSQFLCIGSLFTKDIVQRYWKGKQLTEKQTVWLARGFVVLIVSVTYLLSLAEPRQVFTLGIWCFSGFTGLVPLVFAAVYWKRLTAAGAYACIIVVLISWGFLFYQSGFGLTPRYSFYGLMPVLVITIGSTIAMVAVSLLTKPPPPSTLAKFFDNADS